MLKGQIFPKFLSKRANIFKSLFFIIFNSVSNDWPNFVSVVDFLIIFCVVYLISVMIFPTCQNVCSLVAFKKFCAVFPLNLLKSRSYRFWNSMFVYVMTKKFDCWFFPWRFRDEKIFVLFEIQPVLHNQPVTLKPCCASSETGFIAFWGIR